MVMTMLPAHKRVRHTDRFSWCDISREINVLLFIDERKLRLWRLRTFQGHGASE